MAFGEHSTSPWLLPALPLHSLPGAPAILWLWWLLLPSWLSKSYSFFSTLWNAPGLSLLSQTYLVLSLDYLQLFTMAPRAVLVFFLAPQMFHSLSGFLLFLHLCSYPHILTEADWGLLEIKDWVFSHSHPASCRASYPHTCAGRRGSGLESKYPKSCLDLIKNSLNIHFHPL